MDGRETVDYSANHLVLKQVVSAADEQRLDAIIKLMRRVLGRNTITKAQLRRVLTADQFANYAETLTDVNESSEAAFGRGMPEQLMPYNAMLRKGDLAWARYQNQSRASRARSKSKRNWEDIAESHYKSAAQHLEVILGCARRGDYDVTLGELELWLDRRVSFDPNDPDCVGIDCVSVPRVRGSRSHNAQDAGLPKLSKRLKAQICAVGALLIAGSDFAFDIPQPQEQMLTEEQSAILRDKLTQLTKGK